MVVDTAADGRPAHPGAACEPDPQLGSPSVIPSRSPNSRRGRRKCASPIRQGRVEMDTLYVGIDVSKDRLDVHVHPDGEFFVCARNADGLDDLITRLKKNLPSLTRTSMTLCAARLFGAKGKIC